MEVDSGHRRGEHTDSVLAHLATGRLPRDLKWADVLTELEKVASVRLHDNEASVVLENRRSSKFRDTAG